MLLKKKWSVITGCNRGIGKSILEVFAKNKSNIYACARTVDKNFKTYINKTQKKYNVIIKIIKLDLSNESNVKDAAIKISNENKIDILINNAGVLQNSLFNMTTRKMFNEIFEINFFSQMIFSQYISKNMIKNKSGSIVNVSSNNALIPTAGRVAYSASKSALITATKIMSIELGRYNIRVNAIAPGLTQTEMMTNHTSDKFINQTIDRIPINRIGKPEEIANSVLFLASDSSSYVSGEILSVDGGYN